MGWGLGSSEVSEGGHVVILFLYRENWVFTIFFFPISKGTQRKLCLDSVEFIRTPKQNCSHSLHFLGLGLLSHCPQLWSTQDWVIITGFWAGISPAVSSVSWARPEIRFTAPLTTSVKDRDRKASEVMGGLWKRHQEGCRRQWGSVHIRPWDSHKKVCPCGREGGFRRTRRSFHTLALWLAPLLCLLVVFFIHWSGPPTAIISIWALFFKSLCRPICCSSVCPKLEIITITICTVYIHDITDNFFISIF